MILANQFFINLYIDNEEYPTGPGSFDKIMTMQNVVQKVPTCMMRLRDYSKILLDNEGPLSDGTQIRIEFGRVQDKEEATSVEFTTIAAPQMQEIPGGIRHEIRGMLDTPKCWELATKPYNMSSSDAIKAIADVCELKSEVDGTNDKNIWRPNHYTNYDFISAIAQKGWASASSIMQFAINENKVLKYKNLETAIKGSSKATFSFGAAPAKSKGKNFTVVSRTFKTMAGPANIGGNYGTRATRETMNGSSQQQDRFEAPKGSSFFNISNRFKKSVETNKVRSMSLPPDYGNTSDKYDKGIYQNFRGLNTFTNIVYVLIMEASEVNLLDVVTYNEGNSTSGSSVSAVNGNYFVTGKTRLIQGTHYYEKLELSSQGVSTDKKGKLL